MDYYTSKCEKVKTLLMKRFSTNNPVIVLKTMFVIHFLLMNACDVSSRSCATLNVKNLITFIKTVLYPSRNSVMNLAPICWMYHWVNFSIIFRNFRYVQLTIKFAIEISERGHNLLHNEISKVSESTI